MRLLISLLILLSTVSPLAAATIWVATNGSNTTGNGTEGNPYLTITHAYSLASGNDTVMVKSGVYASELTTSWGLNLNKNNISSAPITVKSQVRHGAIIDNNDHAASQYTVTINGNYNILDGFVIRDSATICVVVHGDDNIIQNNEIYDCGNQADPDSGLGLGSGIDVDDDGNTVRNNYIHHAGRPECANTGTHCNLDHGIYLRVSNVNIINNIIAFNEAYGIHFHDTPGSSTLTSAKVYNNVVYSHDRSALIFNYAVSGTLEIKNNIFYHNGLRSGAAIDLFNDCTGSNIVISSNILNDHPGGTVVRTGTCSFSQTGTINDNPDFTNAAAGDFTLQGTSPALDAGLALTESSPDYTGLVTRPQGSGYDMGAFEAEDGGDIIDPVVTITGPTSNTTYSTATTPITTIAGTATDAVGTTAVTWANSATSGSGSGSGCSGQTSCNWSVSSISLNEGSNPITITGTDAASNTGTDTITVTLDSTAPSRSNGSPSGALAAGTTSTSISLTTNETATCKYGTSAGTSYASLPNTFSSTNSTSHSTTVSGLSNGNSYTYYVRCQDSLNNANTSDFTISFSINTGAPVFPGVPTGLSDSAASTPTFTGVPTGLSDSAASTPAIPGAATSLSDSAAATPSFPGQPTGVSGP